jgi:hypothetical protein
MTRDRVKLGTSMRAIACGEPIYLDDLENMLGIQALIATAERSAREAAIREMVILSGKIEVEGHTTFEEWRAFKRFRNTMYDSLPSEGERE